MGITFSSLQKLKDRSVLSRCGLNVLDIGSSNLYSADAPEIINYVYHFQPNPESQLDVFAKRLAKGSGYDPVLGGLNESFVGELIERCGMKYLSFDIAEGYKTEIFDLNSKGLPDKYRNEFDVVLNFGTTEHILNQYNCFKVIHDATRAGGFMVHQLPVSGFTDHGYFVYTGRMFFDLAKSNNYEIVDLWYEGPAGEDDVFQSARTFASSFPLLGRMDLPHTVGIPNCALTIIYRKSRNNSFTGMLETSTSVGIIPDAVHDTNIFGFPLLIVNKIRSAVGNSDFLRRHPRIMRLMRRLFGRKY